MKKTVFLLAFLLAMLLLTSAAFAANCEVCGSSNVTNVGSGSWCHWDCSDCGSRTSRSHNPNSHNSSLVPASCSGKCTWCGASAVWSSHTFTTWEPAGDGTCTVGGTEISHCANVQCSATDSRSAGPLGHDYTVTVVKPTCTAKGYTHNVCNRCGDTYDDQEKAALSHLYGVWTYQGDGTHSASCTRTGCGSVRNASCTTSAVTVSGQTMELCSLCGHAATGEALSGLKPSTNATAKALDGAKLPGRLMVLVDAAPLDVELTADAFYMFITELQFNGQPVDYTGPMKVTIDLNEYPFSLPGSILANMTPAELMSVFVKLVRVEQEDLNGEAAEVWNELPFTLEKGVLTFETDRLGTFLMVLNVAGAPSVG